MMDMFELRNVLKVQGGGTVVHLRRLHSVHPANNSFKQLIAFLSGIHLKCITTAYDIAIGLCAIVYYKQYR